MTGLPAEPRPEHKPVWQRLWWLIGIVADVAAVLTVFASSAQTIAVVFGAVALLLGAWQLVRSLGKPVDRRVLFAVAGIVAGAVTIAVVFSRSVVERPAQASGGTSGATTTVGPAPAEPTTTTRSTSTAPDVRRTSGDKPILLTNGYAVDLDSQEPNWGANRLIEVSGRDLYYDAGTLWADKDLAPATAQATLDDCLRAGYRRHNGEIELTTDAAFCVKTTSGAYARIVITAVDGHEQLTLDVVVWQRQTWVAASTVFMSGVVELTKAAASSSFLSCAVDRAVADALVWVPHVHRGAGNTDHDRKVTAPRLVASDKEITLCSRCFRSWRRSSPRSGTASWLTGG